MALMVNVIFSSTCLEVQNLFFSCTCLEVQNDIYGVDISGKQDFLSN